MRGAARSPRRVRDAAACAQASVRVVPKSGCRGVLSMPTPAVRRRRRQRNSEGKACKKRCAPRAPRARVPSEGNDTTRSAACRLPEKKSPNAASAESPFSRFVIKKVEVPLPSVLLLKFQPCSCARGRGKSAARARRAAADARSAQRVPF